MDMPRLIRAHVCGRPEMITVCCVGSLTRHTSNNRDVIMKRVITEHDGTRTHNGVYSIFAREMYLLSMVVTHRGRSGTHRCERVALD